MSTDKSILPEGKRLKEIKIVYLDQKIRLGCHIPKKGTLTSSLLSTLDKPLSAYQIFLSSAQSLSQINPNIDDLENCKKFLSMYNKYLCAHGSLLINLCGSADGSNLEQRTRTMLDRTISELDIGSAIGIGVVIHTGSYRDKKVGVELIIKNIVQSLTEITEMTETLAEHLNLDPKEIIKNRKIILENAAGEGTKIGKTLDEIGEIIKGCPKKLRKQVRVCIDTAHIFGAGQYNFGHEEETDRFYSDFDSKIGLDYLELFHLNDSRVPFGSRKDRHENLGDGDIFLTESSLKYFVDEAIRRNKVLIGEPPKKTKTGEKGPGFKKDYGLLEKLCKINETIYQ